MIDLGTQTKDSVKYGRRDVREILLYWELLADDDGGEVRMEDGRPFSISNRYTWSMDKKANLRKALDAWRGTPFKDSEADGFEITNLLDKYCMIQVVHNQSGDKTYANVGTLMSTKKIAKGINELSSFSIEDPDIELYNTFPEWLKTVISEAQEWNEEEPADRAVDEEDDTPVIVDLPF